MPNSLSRPADLFLFNWSRGRPAALDVHVISPLQQQRLKEATSTLGHAFEIGIKCKLTSHLSACRSVGVEINPFVIETLGGSNEDTISTIHTLGQAIGKRVTAPDPSISFKHLFHHTAIALWRGKARLWLPRHPILPPALDGLI